MTQDAPDTPHQGVKRPYRLPGQLLAMSMYMMFSAMTLCAIGWLVSPVLEFVAFFPGFFAFPCLVAAIYTALTGPDEEPEEHATSDLMP